MKIYPYLSDRREINETDVKDVETCNLQKLYGTILIFIRSTILIISGDFLLTRWNTIIVREKGEGK